MHYGRVPRIDPGRWALTIGGATADGAQTVLDLPALQAMPQISVVADLHCVSKVSVTGLGWTGVSLGHLLSLAPPAAGVEHVLFSACYGYSASVHLVDLRSPDALVATGLDGVPLTPEHGWPARVILPHLYGFKGPKWVMAMDYHELPPHGYWEQHGYHSRARVWDEERYAHQE